MPLKLIACIGFLYKVVHKIDGLRKFNGACANTSRRSSTRHEEPRTRIQKPTKGSGWQANWREHFCLSPTLKTCLFPLSIRLLFRPITSPAIKKSTPVADLDSNQEKVMAQKTPDATSSNGEAQERRLSAPIHCSFEAHSLLSSHFQFLPDNVQGCLHCQIQVQIPILFLLHPLPHFAFPGRFGQALNLLKRD